jgi:hypothetical protein
MENMGFPNILTAQHQQQGQDQQKQGVQQKHSQQQQTQSQSQQPQNMQISSQDQVSPLSFVAHQNLRNLQQGQQQQHQQAQPHGQSQHSSSNATPSVPEILQQLQRLQHIPNVQNMLASLAGNDPNAIQQIISSLQQQHQQQQQQQQQHQTQNQSQTHNQNQNQNQSPSQTQSQNQQQQHHQQQSQASGASHLHSPQPHVNLHSTSHTMQSQFPHLMSSQSPSNGSPGQSHPHQMNSDSGSHHSQAHTNSSQRSGSTGSPLPSSSQINYPPHPMGSPTNYNPSNLAYSNVQQPANPPSVGSQQGFGTTQSASTPTQAEGAMAEAILRLLHNSDSIFKLVTPLFFSLQGLSEPYFNGKFLELMRCFSTMSSEMNELRGRLSSVDNTLFRLEKRLDGMDRAFQNASYGSSSSNNGQSTSQSSSSQHLPTKRPAEKESHKPSITQGSSHENSNLHPPSKRRKEEYSTRSSMAENAMALRQQLTGSADGILCFNCGSQDHMTKHCIKERKSCRRCGKPGHIAQFCLSEDSKLPPNLKLEIAKQNAAKGLKNPTKSSEAARGGNNNSSTPTSVSKRPGVTAPVKSKESAIDNVFQAYLQVGNKEVPMTLGQEESKEEKKSDTPISPVLNPGIGSPVTSITMPTPIQVPATATPITPGTSAASSRDSPDEEDGEIRGEGGPVESQDIASPSNEEIDREEGIITPAQIEDCELNGSDEDGGHENGSDEDAYISLDEGSKVDDCPMDEVDHGSLDPGEDVAASPEQNSDLFTFAGSHAFNDANLLFDRVKSNDPDGSTIFDGLGFLSTMAASVPHLPTVEDYQSVAPPSNEED